MNEYYNNDIIKSNYYKQTIIPLISAKYYIIIMSENIWKEVCNAFTKNINIFPYVQPHDVKNEDIIIACYERRKIKYIFAIFQVAKEKKVFDKILDQFSQIKLFKNNGFTKKAVPIKRFTILENVVKVDDFYEFIKDRIEHESKSLQHFKKNYVQNENMFISLPKYTKYSDIIDFLTGDDCISNISNSTNSSYLSYSSNNSLMDLNINELFNKSEYPGITYLYNEVNFLKYYDKKFFLKYLVNTNQIFSTKFTGNLYADIIRNDNFHQYILDKQNDEKSSNISKNMCDSSGDDSSGDDSNSNYSYDNYSDNDEANIEDEESESQHNTEYNEIDKEILDVIDISEIIPCENGGLVPILVNVCDISLFTITSITQSFLLSHFEICSKCNIINNNDGTNFTYILKNCDLVVNKIIKANSYDYEYGIAYYQNDITYPYDFEEISNKEYNVCINIISNKTVSYDKYLLIFVKKN